MPSDRRETSCYVLRNGNRLLVLDAGTGLRRLITQPELLADVVEMDILLSHFHADHTIGLTYLPAIAGAVEISVWGPCAPGYGRTAAAFLDAFTGFPFQPMRLASVVRRVEVIDEGTRDIGGLRISARVQQRHSHPSMAYRVEDLVTYCTDTDYDYRNASFAQGSGILLHEAWAVTPPADPHHSLGTQAAAVASAAHVRELLLVHLHPTVDEAMLLSSATAIFSNTRLADDLMRLELPN